MHGTTNNIDIANAGDAEGSRGVAFDVKTHKVPTVLMVNNAPRVHHPARGLSVFVWRVVEVNPVVVAVGLEDGI